FSSRRRHTRSKRDWSSDVCSSDLERVVTERIAPPVKPLITADPGRPVDRWPDPDFSDTAAYAPWLSSDEGLVKWGTGQRHGGFFSSRLISVVPGDVVTVEAAISFVAGPLVGHI